jgi:hypothetical protein
MQQMARNATLEGEGWLSLRNIGYWLHGGLEPIPARLEDQQMLFQWPGFRVGKGLHCVSLQRVIGGVRHDFHGSLFHGEIGRARSATIKLPDRKK